MDAAKELILALKRKNKSHAGYGLQRECEALVGQILVNMVKSPLPKLLPETKNDQDSVRYREEGNQQFVSGDDIEAIESYTLSLAYARSEELLAYAHANRSAALYRKQMYEECLVDIAAALGHGYPEEKRRKLEERGAKALGEIKKQQQQQQQQRTKRYSAPRLARGPSEEAPAATDGLVLSFSSRFGRHFVASKDFKPGDVLTLEEPYARVVYPERYYTHCHRCLARSYNLIPCPECPIAQYCSEKCRETAWRGEHEIECPILALLGNLLHVDEDKIRMLTKIIRLLIRLTDNGTKIAEVRRDAGVAESNTDDRTAGFTEEGKLESESARSALGLATNMTSRPLAGLGAFACISALAAVLLATRTKFFSRIYRAEDLGDARSPSELPADIRFCGSLMFRACVIMSSNCFSVQQEPGVKSGSGLYVTHSLYNHSCAPNTFRHFEGLRMITRALVPISPGDQVFTSYGASYAHMTRSQRREKIMRDYFFECQCRACRSDWPTYDEILRNHVGTIAKNKRLVEAFEPFRQRLSKNKYDIEAVESVLGILYNEVEQPCEEIIHAEHYLKSFYLDP